jgi:hypothetical protein
MIKKSVLPLLAAGVLDTEVFADYFDDQGNRLGRFRTDYTSPTEGTLKNPLEIDTSECYYGQEEFGTERLIEVHSSEACPTGPGVYPGGSYFHSNVPDDGGSFWVLSVNVEVFAFAEDDYTGAPLGELQGPPNLSTSLTGPPGLTRFKMLPANKMENGARFAKWESGGLSWKKRDSNRGRSFRTSKGDGGSIQGYEAHLVIDNEGPDGEPRFLNAIPFLGFGAQKDWGNEGYVGRMNHPNAPHSTYWVSRLERARAGRPQDAMSHNIVANARWGGKIRMIQLLLHHHNVESSTEWIPGTHRHWNWPAKNSFWYPGADIVFIDAEDVETHCGENAGYVPRIVKTGVSYEFLVDWEVLFRCLSDRGLFDDPMPDDEVVPLLGIHWVVELFGNATIWAVVSGMEMVQ